MGRFPIDGVFEHIDSLHPSVAIVVPNVKRIDRGGIAHGFSAQLEAVFRYGWKILTTYWEPHWYISSHREGINLPCI